MEIFAADKGDEEEQRKFELAPAAAAAGGGGGGGAAASGGTRACGSVVGIVKRNWRPYVCVLDPESALGSQFLVEPLDSRVPKVNISTRQPEVLKGT